MQHYFFYSPTLQKQKRKKSAPRATGDRDLAFPSPSGVRHSCCSEPPLPPPLLKPAAAASAAQTRRHRRCSNQPPPPLLKPAGASAAQTSRHRRCSNPPLPLRPAATAEFNRRDCRCRRAQSSLVVGAIHCRPRLASEGCMMLPSGCT
ncbi:unnamed protein product [Cuscuta campestris]|uniref:Uncharacterized protein n=1 Tax=Cuscuta campestris TaxID=132261 RepID=A0A484KWR8_9ASTE|nr:unnamed protein product [Cuscuta campestris]